MGDAETRTLERRARGGDPEARAASLRAARRAGCVSRIVARERSPGGHPRGGLVDDAALRALPHAWVFVDLSPLKTFSELDLAHLAQHGERLQGLGGGLLLENVSPNVRVAVEVLGLAAVVLLVAPDTLRPETGSP